MPRGLIGLGAALLILDYWLLAAAPEMVYARSEVVRRVLSALVQAVRYIHQHPDESKRIVSRYVSVPLHGWDVHDFSVQLDSVVAQTLTANAAMIQGGRQELPAFQRYFYYQGLYSILPSALLPARCERV